MKLAGFPALLAAALLSGCGSAGPAHLGARDREHLLATLPAATTPAAQARTDLASFRADLARLTAAGHLALGDARSLAAIADQAAAKLPVPASTTIPSAPPQPAPVATPARHGKAAHPHGGGNGGDGGDGGD